MKTTMFTLAMLLLSSLMTINAQNVIYTNTDRTDVGTVKECIAYNTHLSQPTSKTIYTYNENGDMISKVIWKWIDGEWQTKSKSEFSYEDAKLLLVTHTKWNNSTNNWAKDSQYTNFLYDNNGDFLTTIDSKGDSETLVTAR